MRRLRRRLGHSGLSLLGLSGLALIAAAGCHQLFDGELGAVRCEEEGVHGPPVCPEGQTCIGGACAAIGTPLGGPCAQDADCTSGFCLDPAMLGESGSPRCTRPCCGSADCGDPRERQVCRASPGLAGNTCWPAAALGRALPGDSRAWEPCVDGSECRSGACADGRCQDVCCSDSYCADGAVCRVSSEPGWRCGPPIGTSLVSCQDPSECVSGICQDVGGDSQCVRPCCSSAACGTLSVADTDMPVACTPFGEGKVGCAALLQPGAIGAVGSPCDDDGQCRGGVCLAYPAGAPKMCSDTCCSDESCGDTSAFACRVVDHLGTTALRCVRR